MALKNPWVQSIHSHVEANLFYEYYKTRYILFSHNQEDWSEAKNQLEKASKLVNKVSEYQMQVFETLGLIQTCYKMDSELQSAIDDIYDYKTITVYTFPEELNNQIELENLMTKQKQIVQELIDMEYNNKLVRLVNILKLKLKQDYY